jgi:pilus assembly protein CpaC
MSRQVKVRSRLRQAVCIFTGVTLVFVLCGLRPLPVQAQRPAKPLNNAGVVPAQAREPLVLDTPATQQKIDQLISDVLLPEALLELDPRRSKLIRTKQPVVRFSITNPEIVDVVQFSPTEFELVGGSEGETTLTLWFGGGGGPLSVLRYIVRVSRDVRTEERRQEEYGDLQDMINEMFPNSVVLLIPVADKLIVRGQARDAKEATEIMAIISSQAANIFSGGSIVQGPAANPYPGVSNLPASNVVNMLDVPGEQQVMLKVRVAELTRSAVRDMGFDTRVMTGDFNFTSMLGVAGAFQAVLTTDDVRLALSAISSNSYGKILAEPNLVTLSGRPATFLAGGEFAVPIVVGVEGAAAATTNFRSFGTQLSFTPTVIDKDRIRLQVTPSFSTLNAANAVNGIPGLNSRTVSTTVDLREGQWLAIAGLLQDQQEGSKARIPLIGDIPVLDAIFSRKHVKRDETELIVLVSPELIHPMEVEQTPLILPGMEVTEPTDWAFFMFGRYEGRPNCDHRGTMYPIQRQRTEAALLQSIREAKQSSHYQRSEKYYMQGNHGFSR